MGLFSNTIPTAISHSWLNFLALAKLGLQKFHNEMVLDNNPIVAYFLERDKNKIYSKMEWFNLNQLRLFYTLELAFIKNL